jgi:hypothetical protein
MKISQASLSLGGAAPTLIDRNNDFDNSGLVAKYANAARAHGTLRSLQPTCVLNNCCILSTLVLVFSC